MAGRKQRGEDGAPRQAGRPSKFTPETTETVLAAIKLGAPYRTAAAAAGISEDTLARWLNKPDEKDFADFAEAFARAEAEFQLSCIASIRKAAQERKVVVKQVKVLPNGTTVEQTTTRVEMDWRASAYLLERRDPARWQEKPYDPMDDVPDEMLVRFNESGDLAEIEGWMRERRR